MEDLKKRLSNLLAVKSIVTVILTAVFADLSMAGRPFTFLVSSVVLSQKTLPYPSPVSRA